MTQLTNPRYSRQIQLPGIGFEGQEKLANARVLVVGVGGLGSPASLYLAAAGVGHLGLIDDDVVSLSNLQRQILYGTEDEGKSKVMQAERRLADLNPEIEIETHAHALTRENAQELFANYDIILDGTDNFKTRYLISEACEAAGKPHVYGGIFQFEGHVAIFEPKTTACYRCLFPQRPSAGEIPNCSEAGVLGALPGIIGSLQALETLKYILKLESKPGHLFVFDALTLETRNLKLNANHAAHADTRTSEQLAQDNAKETSASNAPKNAMWIDVRSENEFAQGHHLGARNIPVSILADSLSNLPKNQTYVVYCASGKRSATAQTVMIRNGFTEVWNLRGGLVL